MFPLFHTFNHAVEHCHKELIHTYMFLRSLRLPLILRAVKEKLVLYWRVALNKILDKVMRPQRSLSEGREWGKYWVSKECTHINVNHVFKHKARCILFSKHYFCWNTYEEKYFRSWVVIAYEKIVWVMRLISSSNKSAQS